MIKRQFTFLPSFTTPVHPCISMPSPSTWDWVFFIKSRIYEYFIHKSLVFKVENSNESSYIYEINMCLIRGIFYFNYSPLSYLFPNNYKDNISFFIFTIPIKKTLQIFHFQLFSIFSKEPGMGWWYFYIILFSNFQKIEKMICLWGVGICKSWCHCIAVCLGKWEHQKQISKVSL